jgi:hypothetical protein
MKQQEYFLKIDNPCKEDWNLMKHEGSGRFCSNCSKTVIDFTYLTDSEIVKQLEKSSGRLCGNLNTDQLNRIISIKESKSTPNFYKLLAGLLLLGSTKNLQATNSTSIKTEISIPINKEELPSNEIENTENPTDSLVKIVQGTVLDSATKEPIIGAIINIKNTNKAVTTNIEGKFKITVPNNLPIDSVTLILRCVGYKTKEFIVDKTKFPVIDEVFIMVQMTEALRGDVIILRQNKKEMVPNKKKWWQRKVNVKMSH